MTLLKRCIAQLPQQWQVELKRWHFGRLIKKGQFRSDEPELPLLQNFIRPGDWVIDVGANVGHYTKCFSDLVGKEGRVLAFEPVPTTFSWLAANVQRFEHKNITLFNAAVSDRLDTVGMTLPKFKVGLTNYYRAHLTSGENTLEDVDSLSVLTLSLDSLCITQSIKLVKIDAEGHEAFVLKGMTKLIETAKPILIIETDSKELVDELCALGYEREKLPNSPNVILKPLQKQVESTLS